MVARCDMGFCTSSLCEQLGAQMKTALGHFGSAWGILHSASTKHHRRIEVNPTALQDYRGVTATVICSQPSDIGPRNSLCVTAPQLKPPPPAALSVSDIGLIYNSVL
jgi:hypothetical protein